MEKKIELNLSCPESRCEICNRKTTEGGRIDGTFFHLCSTHMTADHLIHLQNTRK